jgi:hypothetical protein
VAVACDNTAIARHPDTGISNKVMAILNAFVNDIFECITSEAASVLLHLVNLILV